MEKNGGSKFIRKTGSVVGKLLFPISAMRTTVELGKREIERRKEDIDGLKGLAEDARNIIRDRIKGTSDKRDDSFSVVMENRPDDALTQDELYALFLRKKRLALLVAGFFAVTAIFSVVIGAFSGNTRNVALGIVSLLGSQPVFFMVALSSQFRLWQLKTHRLSRAEKGGLRDFMRETPGWWLQTLNPYQKKRGRV